MRYSWGKAIWKSVVQAVIFALSASIASLASKLPPFDSTSEQVMLLYLVFIVLNVLRNWIKQHLIFGKYL
jgi:hypothetical protein